MEYGVARISTRKQNIDRQVRNILAQYPNAKIIKETYTGTKLEGRKDFENVLKIIKEGDTLIFDSVSRMSRNSEEGCNLYEDLFNKGINLIFLKESYINTEVYRKALDNQIKIVLNTGNQATDELMQTIISALNKYTIELAKEQIKKAFDQAEKEVKDLHQKTSEGLLTAKLNGKRVGQLKGTKLETKKSIKAKETIIKYSKDFEGTLGDDECIKLAEVSRNSYYKYKAELKRK
jgi:DNA invertase Pin-like site-specific DNA recombinase